MAKSRDLFLFVCPSGSLPAGTLQPGVNEHSVLTCRQRVDQRLTKQTDNPPSHLQCRRSNFLHWYPWIIPSWGQKPRELSRKCVWWLWSHWDFSVALSPLELMIRLDVFSHPKWLRPLLLKDDSVTPWHRISNRSFWIYLSKSKIHHCLIKWCFMAWKFTTRLSKQVFVPIKHHL